MATRFHTEGYFKVKVAKDFYGTRYLSWWEVIQYHWFGRRNFNVSDKLQVSKSVRNEPND
jgi:hypothetical protein